MKYGIVVFLLLFSHSLEAQPFPGFSKLYKYSGDTLFRQEAIGTITYDTMNQKLFFCSSGICVPSSTFYTTLYKSDLQGNIQIGTIDSLSGGSVGYSCVAESKDHRYLYWGGYSLVYGDSSSIHWKVRKTDKDLNIIWEKFYAPNAASNNSYNIKALENGDMMLLCFAYTDNNNLGLPVQPSTISMRRIDSMGNLLSEYFPVDWPYTNAYGMEFTNDGGYMINGGSSNRCYTLKTDNIGIHQSHEYYANDLSKSWFNGLRKQAGINETYLNTGGVVIDAAGNGAGIASKIDAAGTEIWEKRLSKKGYADELFDIANGRNLSAVFAGASYDTTLQAARGWMVKLDDNGNKIWDKLYTSPHRSQDDDYIWKVIPMPDGGFLAAGSTYGQEPNGRWSQYGWLLRVDSNGCADPECANFTAIKDVNASKEAISIFPNPSSGLVHLSKPSIFPENTAVVLIDATGKTLKELESPSGKKQEIYNLKGLCMPGIYFLKITMSSEILQKKIVITF